MNIAERIKKRRAELGLSVDDLASKIGKDRSTIYRYESKYIKELPTSILEPLAAALQTTPAFLMGWTDKKTDVDDIQKAAPEEQLNDEQKALLKSFMSLSEDKRRQVLDYMRFLLSTENG